MDNVDKSERLPTQIMEEFTESFCIPRSKQARIIFFNTFIIINYLSIINYTD